MSIHVKRLVHPESIGALDFRNHLPKAFPNPGLEVQTDGSLHTTLLNDRLNAASIETIAEALRGEPDSCSESFTSNIIGAEAYGGVYRGGRESIVLLLEEDEHFNEDRQHYTQFLGRETLRRFNPHITLAKAPYVSLPETRRMIDWVQERMPTTINLARVSIRLSSTNSQPSLTKAS